MEKKRILIEGFTLAEGKKDGCFRYTVELLKGLHRLQVQENFDFGVEVLIGGQALPLSDLAQDLEGYLHRHWEKRASIERMAKLRQKTADIITSTAPFLIKPLKKIDHLFKLTKKIEKSHVSALPRGKHYDLIHLTLPQSFNLIENQKTHHHLVTIHDCTHRLFPEFHTWENVDRAEQGFQFSVKKEATFIAVSESAKTDLINLYNVSPDRVFTIYEAANPSIFLPIRNPSVIRSLKDRYNIPQDAHYLLTLSTLEPRKNLTNTLKAFGKLKEKIGNANVYLVIAGQLGWKYDQFLSELENQRDKIIFTNFVPDKDLAALYSGALGFSFVSHYEGFGLPALEAMMCGIPVVFGNRGSLPEVVGDGGLPADPEDIDDISSCFANLIQDSEKREALSLKALDRAGQFSWDTTAKRTFAIYQSLLDKTGKG